MGKNQRQKKEKKIFVNNIKKETKTWYAVCSFFFFFPALPSFFMGGMKLIKFFFFLSYCEDSEENVTTNMYGKKKSFVHVISSTDSIVFLFSWNTHWIYRTSFCMLFIYDFIYLNEKTERILKILKPNTKCSYKNYLKSIQGLYWCLYIVYLCF